MGCFSFLCQECNKPINSDSQRGERVTLWHLKSGRIEQEMTGEYDSYGRVFIGEFNDDLRESVMWDDDWGDVVDDTFNLDKSYGIAAIHEACYKDLIPIERSESDPDQGWGKLHVKHLPE